MHFMYILYIIYIVCVEYVWLYDTLSKMQAKTKASEIYKQFLLRFKINKAMHSICEL